MMYSIANPFRLDQGDVSFDAPDSVKSAMTRAIADNHTHYLQTNGLPRLRELIAAKLRDKNAVPVDNPDDVLVTWQQLVALHRQWHSLTKELKDAEQALGQDNSEGNYLRLRDIKARLSQMDGTEALIEGFGASSGRGVRSL